MSKVAAPAVMVAAQGGSHPATGLAAAATVAQDPPLRSVQVSPSDNAVNLGVTPTLVAKVAEPVDGTSYEFAFTVCPGTTHTGSSGCGGSNQLVVQSGWVSSGTWKAPAGKLLANTTYSWSVAVRDNAYLGTIYNDVRVFATGATLSAPNSALPVLVSPADVSVLNSRTPVLKASISRPRSGVTYEYKFGVKSFDGAISWSSAWTTASQVTVPSIALSWIGTGGAPGTGPDTPGSPTASSTAIGITSLTQAQICQVSAATCAAAVAAANICAAPFSGVLTACFPGSPTPEAPTMVYPETSDVTELDLSPEPEPEPATAGAGAGVGFRPPSRCQSQLDQGPYHPDDPRSLIAQIAAEGVGSGNAYSVVFQTTLSDGSYPGVSRQRHFQEANSNLLYAMKSDPSFAQAMENLIPGLRNQLQGPRSVSRSAPKDWTWHHAAERGVMQLVPTAQHTAPGSLQQLFHPGGVGGMALWGC